MEDLRREVQKAVPRLTAGCMGRHLHVNSATNAANLNNNGIANGSTTAYQLRVAGISGP